MGWLDCIFTRLASAIRQAPTLQRWHAYLQQQSVLDNSPLGAELHGVLEPVEHETFNDHPPEASCRDRLTSKGRHIPYS